MPTGGVLGLVTRLLWVYLPADACKITVSDGAATPASSLCRLLPLLQACALRLLPPLLAVLRSQTAPHTGALLRLPAWRQRRRRPARWGRRGLRGWARLWGPP